MRQTPPRSMPMQPSQTRLSIAQLCALPETYSTLTVTQELTLWSLVAVVSAHN